MNAHQTRVARHGTRGRRHVRNVWTSPTAGGPTADGRDQQEVSGLDRRDRDWGSESMSRLLRQSPQQMLAR